jgi:hypothetical protein
MKRTMGMVLGGLIAFASPTALAERMAMSDAQLDEVTAAGAVVGHMVFNAGKEHELVLRGDPSNPTYLRCINCVEALPLVNADSAHAQGMHFISNRGHPVPMVKCFGGFPSLIC